MSATLSSQEFLLMQKYIEENSGIELAEEKAYLIESRLSKILADSGLSSFEELYHLVTSHYDPQMTNKIIDAITTNETFWFRDKLPWELLEEIHLPRLIQEFRAGKRINVRIWSAACSTGQEPYSIAMCIDKYLQRNGITDIRPVQFEIIATDISQTVLEIAKMGRYNSISMMRGLEDYYRNHYFTSQNQIWSLDERIKKMVRFEKFNLLDSYLTFDQFSVVFCRYVLIYFSENLRREIVRKIAGVLEPEGILSLGGSELMTDCGTEYATCSFKTGVYFQKR